MEYISSYYSFLSVGVVLNGVYTENETFYMLINDVINFMIISFVASNIIYDS